MQNSDTIESIAQGRTKVKVDGKIFAKKFTDGFKLKNCNLRVSGLRDYKTGHTAYREMRMM